MTYLGLKFALDTLKLVVGVDVVAEGGPRVRRECAQVAVVDLGIQHEFTSHLPLPCQFHHHRSIIITDITASLTDRGLEENVDDSNIQEAKLPAS